MQVQYIHPLLFNHQEVNSIGSYCYWIICRYENVLVAVFIDIFIHVFCYYENVLVDIVIPFIVTKIMYWLILLSIYLLRRECI